MRLLTSALCFAAVHAFASSGGEAVGSLLVSSIEISCRVSTAASAANGTSRSADSTARDCSVSSDCHPAYECTAMGRCVTRSLEAAPASQTSMRRQGTELLVRNRVVELREELALGRGPVISHLARAEGVPAEKLGRVLREHRAELLTLIGAADGSAWAGQFMNRVEQLSRPA